MRGVFRRRAQRDVLRETETNIEQDNQPNHPQKQPIKQTSTPRGTKRKHLVTAFLLAALGNEAAHFHVPQNPHGNRRERIEEIRMRTQEAETHAKRYRNAAGHGGGGTPDPFHPVEIAVQEARRRGVNRLANNA